MERMPRSPELIIAHPGHELVLFGWMEESRPVVSILTDGSGRGGVSRLASSLRIIREAGAETGLLAGLTDRQFYDAILDTNVALFVDLAVKLGETFAAQEPPYVVSDAREGFNPIHDLCAMIAAAAIRHSGAAIAHYELALFQPHDRHAADARERGICRTLTDDQLRRKIETAHSCPELAGEIEWAFAGKRRKGLERYPDLAAIFETAIEGMNERSFATECLRPAGSAWPNGDRPFYERYAERLVGDGLYERAIRYRDHVQPIERAFAEL